MFGQAIKDTTEEDGDDSDVEEVSPPETTGGTTAAQTTTGTTANGKHRSLENGDGGGKAHVGNGSVGVSVEPTGDDEEAEEGDEVCFDQY